MKYIHKKYNYFTHILPKKKKKKQQQQQKWKKQEYPTKLTKTGQGKREENWKDFSSHKKEKKKKRKEKNWRYF